MTIKELKELLENYDENLEVKVGYDEEDDACLYIDNEIVMICYR